MPAGLLIIFLWLVLQSAKSDDQKNCSEHHEDLIITPYYIYTADDMTEVGFNLSFGLAGDRSVCLNDVNINNSPQCKSHIHKSYVTFEKASYGQLAEPMLNVSFWYGVDFKDKNTHSEFICRYYPPEQAETILLRNMTDYPTPEISVKTLDWGINVSWSLENIAVFSTYDADLRLIILLDGHSIDLDEAKLYQVINITLNENENATITAYFEDKHGSTGTVNSFTVAGWKLYAPRVLLSHFGSEKIAWILFGTCCPAVLSLIVWFLCRKRQPSQLVQVVSSPHNVVRWHSEYNPLYFIEPTGKSDTFNRVIKFKELKHVRNLGEGNYGQVDLYRWPTRQHPRGLLVAVKTFKDLTEDRDVKQFQNELDIFRKVGFHPNIVEFLGSNGELPWFIVTEYMENGDLANHLRCLRNGFNNKKETSIDEESHKLRCHHHVEVLTSKDLEYYAKEIATGMAHLEKCKVVHRDLAARNVLLGRNKSVKIADFGLSRQGTYFNTHRCQLPVRWMAPETFMEPSLLMCTSKSDVWSFGVVLWEIGTLGALPYENMNFYQMQGFIRDNRRLPRPELVRNSLYMLMLQCWSYNFEDRPSFRDILSQIDSMSAYFEFTDLQPTYQFPPTFDKIPSER